ncbi:MAG: RimK family alpha-L-glutamate ligase [Planctomycetaceae bacterium]|nr:RimK family alpha-L-glutamate ligase [Planctomycetaceae bacterium]
MHLVILSNPSSWYRRDLERAASERGHRVTGLPFEGLIAHVAAGRSSVAGRSEELADVDAVIVRTMPPGSLEQVVFRMNLLAELENRGVQVLNSAKSIECAVDKYLTTARLASVGLSVPETIVCETAEAALAAFEQLRRDVVVKPLFGSEGRGILRVSDPDLALRTFRTLERLQAVLYVQEFIPHEGYDVRVMVLDGRVLAGMRRRNPHDFRTNVARQAQAESVELTDCECEWAVRAAAAVGARLAGIDLLYDRSGKGYVIEANGVPGWQALRRVTGCDVAGAVIDSLERSRSLSRERKT